MAKTDMKKQDIVDILEDRILFFDLRPGAVISDKVIAEELGVGRTPVREALLTLKQERLVDIYTQSGTFVSLIDTDYIKEINYIRHNVEAQLIIGLAQAKIDMADKLEKYILFQSVAAKEGNQREFVSNDHKFHREIFEIAGHVQAWDIIESQYKQTTRYDMLSFGDDEETVKQILQEHNEIIKCVANGDIAKLTRLIVEHHDINLSKYSDLKAKYSNYFLN